MIEQLMQNNILIAAIVIAVSYLGGRLFTKSAPGKEAAAEVAQKLRKYGLDEIPKLLEAYSMGNIKGMVAQIHHLKLIVGNKELMKQELEEVFERMLAEKIKNPILRKVIEDRVKSNE